MKQWIYKLLLFLFTLLSFSFVYFHKLKPFIKDDKERLEESLNISIMTQTLTGLYSPPPSREIKNIVMIQALTGFLFLSGFILHLIHTLKQ